MYTAVWGLPVVHKSALTDTLLNEWMKAGTIENKKWSVSTVKQIADWWDY